MKITTNNQFGLRIESAIESVCGLVYSILQNGTKANHLNWQQVQLTFDMSKCTEDASWTVTGLLHIIAFGRFVYFRMKLLLRACVTVLAIVARFAIAGLTPLLAVLHIWTRS